MLTLQIYVRPDISHLIQVNHSGELRLSLRHLQNTTSVGLLDSIWEGLGVSQYGTDVQCDPSS